MIPKRPIWLTPHDLRRDYGPVDGLRPGEGGASGVLRYERVRSWLLRANFVAAGLGAGLVVAAPLLAIGGALEWALLIAVGAVCSIALRLALIVRARDRTLGHHGRFLPLLTQIRAEEVQYRPALAEIRLRRALRARHMRDDAWDQWLGALLRGAAPVATGWWLAPSGGAVILASAGAAFVVAILFERQHQTAVSRAEVARSRFARLMWHFALFWPTLRELGHDQGPIDRVRHGGAPARELAVVRAQLRLSALFSLAVPALALGAILAAAGAPSMAMLGLVVACVMAGQMSAVFGVQAVRWVKAAQEHGIADRLIPQENRPVDPIDRIASLEIRDLSYRYPAGPNIVFEQVSLRLDAGEVLALSSPSGTGKTTLLRVITGLAEAQTGQLLVNGQAVSPLVYRHRIAAVFQDQDIGAGTIRAAVAGNLSLDPDSVWQAVGRVGVERLIRDLPMQLQTLIVEGPFPPSLLQPLLIARALVQNADLLILDEALAALSYERAKLLLDELRGEGKLVIFASHDPNIVALADRVLTIGAR